MYSYIMSTLFINPAYSKTLVPLACIANEAAGICGEIPFFFRGSIYSPSMPSNSSLKNGERLAIFSVGNNIRPACDFTASNNFDSIGGLTGIGIRHTDSSASVDMVWSVTASLSMGFNPANLVNYIRAHNINVTNFAGSPFAFSPCYGPSVLNAPNTGASESNYFAIGTRNTLKPRIDYIIQSLNIAKRQGMIMPGRYVMSRNTESVLTLGIYNNNSSSSFPFETVAFPLDLDIIIPIVCRASQTTFTSPEGWISLKNNVYPNQPLGEPFLTNIVYSCTAGSLPNIKMKLASKFTSTVGKVVNNKLYLTDSGNKPSSVYVVGHLNSEGSNTHSCDATTSDAVKFNQESAAFDANIASSGVAIISQSYSWSLCSDTKMVTPGAYKGSINYNLVLK